MQSTCCSNQSLSPPHMVTLMPWVPSYSLIRLRVQPMIGASTRSATIWLDRCQTISSPSTRALTLLTNAVAPSTLSLRTQHSYAYQHSTLQFKQHLRPWTQVHSHLAHCRLSTSTESAPLTFPPGASISVLLH